MPLFRVRSFTKLDPTPRNAPRLRPFRDRDAAAAALAGLPTDGDVIDMSCPSQVVATCIGGRLVMHDGAFAPALPFVTVPGGPVREPEQARFPSFQRGPVTVHSPARLRRQRVR